MGNILSIILSHSTIRIIISTFGHIKSTTITYSVTLYNYITMKLINSPVTSFQYQDRTIYIKHDELLHPDLSGNKARKLAYFMEHDFPHIDTLISYGGTQSNLMFSLSALAKLKGWL